MGLQAYPDTSPIGAAENPNPDKKSEDKPKLVSERDVYQEVTGSHIKVHIHQQVWCPLNS